MLAVGIAELCLQMVAEGTTSAVQLLQKVLCRFSVPACLGALGLEIGQICSGNWRSVVGVVSFLDSRKYLKVPMASVHCTGS